MSMTHMTHMNSHCWYRGMSDPCQLFYVPFYLSTCAYVLEHFSTKHRRPIQTWSRIALPQVMPTHAISHSGQGTPTSRSPPATAKAAIACITGILKVKIWEGQQACAGRCRWIQIKPACDLSHWVLKRLMVTCMHVHLKKRSACMHACVDHSGARAVACMHAGANVLCRTTIANLQGSHMGITCGDCLPALEPHK